MKKNNAYTITVRVYYEDTDAGGVVYHSNYLNFMERARTEWLRDLGYDQDILLTKEQLIFAVKKVVIDFKQPARFNDVLTVSAIIDDFTGASIKLTQRIMKEERLLCEADIQIVSLDNQSFKPKRLSQNLKEDLQRVRSH